MNHDTNAAKAPPPHLPGQLLHRTTTLGFATAAAILSIGTVFQAYSAESGRVPNVVLILTDDQGYSDLGCYGAPLIETPCFDRMAAEGTRFTDFYVQPVCGVSRAALLTGCYPIRLAEPGNTKGGHPVLHPKEITLAEVLKTRGYATALIGKWHLAGQGANTRGPGTGPFRRELMPNAQGFDYFYGTPLHNGFTRRPDAKKFITELMRDDQMLESPADMDLLTRKYTVEAIEFIRQNKDRPFFLYLAHNMPHVPLGASKEFRGESKQGLYGDVIRELDWSCGQVMDTLQELGIDENTLMVYTSDNGPWIEEHLAGDTPVDNYYGSALPLRGSKMMTFDGGLRTPCIMRWPGEIPAGRVCRSLVSSMDLFPTFTHLAGGEVPQDRTIDGHDVLAVITDAAQATSPRETFFYYCYNHLQAVRHRNWKLVLPRPARPRWCSWSARMCSAVEKTELYDLANDVSESNDVADEHPQVVAELVQLIKAARKDLGDYDRVGEGARFFDDGPRRPDVLRWQSAALPIEPQPRDGGGPYPRGFTYTTAIGPEKGVTRRDPSDVIKVGEKYYVWYTKVLASQRGYPSGYPGSIWYASSPDGRKWTEQGACLDPGPDDAWDGHGVFTPNILTAGGKCYLFYTAVPEPFDVPWTKGATPTALGVAVADQPAGPWQRFAGNPILVPQEDKSYFDSFRTDDASLIVRGGKFWLYYKGRQLGKSPAHTKMGLAVAEKPTGPYVKHHAGPLHPGHEVLVRPQGRGVASLATAAGPRRVYFAADGLQFSARNAVANPPHAPGAFRSDDFQDNTAGQGIQWGISHARQGGDLYLVRFDCRFTPSMPPAGPSQGRIKAVPYDKAEPLGSLRFDFESGDSQGWQVVDGRFDRLISDNPAWPNWQHLPFNKQGKYHLSTAQQDGSPKGDDTMTGVVQSPAFVVKGSAMSFLIGGGSGPQTYLALCTSDGREVLTVRGAHGPLLRRVTWDVKQFAGRSLFLRIVDGSTGGWGHVTFDDFSCEGEIEER